MTNKVYLVLFVVLSVVTFPFATAMAGPGVPFAELSDKVDAVQSSVDNLQNDVDAVQSSLDGLSSKVDAMDAKLDGLQHGLTLQASIDTAICASIPVQCANHSYDAADSSNHNPIRLVVQVIGTDGTPVNGLTVDNFSFSNPFVPAGGGTTVICSEASCGTDRFQDGPNGLYSIMLDRGPAGNWDAGAYAGTVIVSTDSGDSGTSMATFEIQ